MAIDLTKQRLYSLRLAVPDDNRYPYGAFNAYYDNQVFYASIREDIEDALIYYFIDKVGQETGIETSDMAWFASYLYYDENRLLNTSLSRMELIEDITDYSKELSSLPTIPDGYTLKWNIYGVIPHKEGRVSNASYLLDDLVYGTIDSGTSYQVYKANTDEATALNSGDWDPVFDVTLNDLYLGVTMEDFVYDMLSNPKWQVVGDFIEGDRIIFAPEDIDNDIATTPFLKYGCNKYRIDLSSLIFDSSVAPLSNVIINITPVDDYTGDVRIGTSTYIFSSSLTDGYYNFEVEDDGIYIVTITYNDAILYQDYLLVTCGIETCIASLMDLIFCNDLDCCKNCSDDRLKEMNFRRNELNKLLLFMNVISATFNYAKINYTGAIVLDSDLHTNMEKASQWYSRVQEIVDRCGTCGETVSTSKPCTQC